MKLQVACAAFATLITVAAASGARADDIAWGHDLTAAQTTAKQANKLIMIDMYTGWCGWCKKLDQDVYPQPTVVQSAAQFVPLKLDAEKTKDGVALTKKFKVTGFPTLLFVDSSGAIVDRIVGYAPAPEFVTALNKVQQDFADFPQLQAQAQANPLDAPAVTRLAGAMLGRDRLDEAVVLVTTLEQRGSGAHLTDLDNQIASTYADRKDTGQALKWYQKTLAHSKVDEELRAAHIGRYEVYAQQKNKPGMIGELKALYTLRGTPPQIKTAIQLMLKQIQSPPHRRATASTKS